MSLLVMSPSFMDDLYSNDQNEEAVCLIYNIPIAQHDAMYNTISNFSKLVQICPKLQHNETL